MKLAIDKEDQIILSKINALSLIQAERFNRTNRWDRLNRVLADNLDRLTRLLSIKGYHVWRVAVCYSVVTEESAEQGGTAENGFEEILYTVETEQALSLARSYYPVSASCFGGEGWLSSEYDRDMENGNETNYTIHIELNGQELQTKRFNEFVIGG